MSNTVSLELTFLGLAVDQALTGLTCFSRLTAKKGGGSREGISQSSG